jgi:hypothetical protein
MVALPSIDGGARMGRTRTFVLAAAVLLGATASAGAATLARVTYQDVLPKTGTGQVTLTTQKAASFRVLLRVPTQGRARLYLLGAKAPKGGPLLDTKPPTGQRPCEGAAGSLYCRSAYEPLPKGTYTWRIVWKGQVKAPVELTVRW